MLKQEHRKLKEDDIRKLVQRTTRQSNKKKMMILEHHFETQKVIDSF